VPRGHDRCARDDEDRRQDKKPTGEAKSPEFPGKHPLPQVDGLGLGLGDTGGDPVDERNGSSSWLRRLASMPASPTCDHLLIPTTRIFDEHTVLAREAYEITFFAIYWIVQTAENWYEKVLDTAPVEAETGRVAPQVRQEGPRSRACAPARLATPG
jgi:hypothetical protein